jgi:hypothetical protein
MEKLRERDLSTIDLRTITLDDWEDLKREVARRAHAERTAATRELVRRLSCWWQARQQRRDQAVHTCESWSKQSLFWSGRI